MAVSDVFHIMRHRDHIQHEFFAGLGDFRERLTTLIQGAPEHGQPSIAQIFDAFSGWLDSDGLIVRFEDLVGERGGGDSTRQANLLKRIFASLGIDLSEDEMRRISNSLFSDASPTFRKGAIGGWREHFDPEISQMFKAVANEQLIRLGYETDSDW